MQRDLLRKDDEEGLDYIEEVVENFQTWNAEDTFDQDLSKATT